jgi:uncharacterized Tic20 family protein
MSYPPYEPIPPMSAGPTSDERSMAMLAHLSAYAGCLIPALGHIGGPLIVLLVRGDRSPYVSYHAREALNFNITMTILAVVTGALIAVLIGLLLLPLVVLVWLILPAVAAFKARDAVPFRYPFTIRLVPER